MPRQVRRGPVLPDATGAATPPSPPGEPGQPGPPPSHRHRGRRILLIAALAAVAAAVATAPIAVPKHHASRPGKVLVTPSVQAGYHVAPNGKGDCVRSACGSLDAAVAKAKAAKAGANATANATGASGAVVEVAAGQYPQQTINEGKNSAVAVVVQAERGAQVRLSGLTVDAAHVTVRGVTVKGPTRIGSTATGSGLDNVTTDQGSVFLGASGSFLTNSRVQPAVDADGVQIKAYGGKNPQGVTIDHTSIGPTHRGPRKVHVDCVQILGGSDIVIRHSRLFHCADQGIIAGSGASGTISGTIEVSYTQIQLCPQRTSDCDGYDAIEMRAPSVVFTHNTVIDGAAIFRVENSTVTSNYFDNLGICNGTFENNLYAKTSCRNLPPSNHRGEMAFVNRASEPPNLTPREAVMMSGAWIGAVPPANKAAGGGG